MNIPSFQHPAKCFKNGISGDMIIPSLTTITITILSTAALADFTVEVLTAERTIFCGMKCGAQCSGFVFSQLENSCQKVRRILIFIDNRRLASSSFL